MMQGALTSVRFPMARHREKVGGAETVTDDKMGFHCVGQSVYCLQRSRTEKDREGCNRRKGTFARQRAALVRLTMVTVHP